MKNKLLSGRSLPNIFRKNAKLETNAEVIDLHAAAIIGRRSEQQDAHYVADIDSSDNQKLKLIVVADGMGGAAGGKIASELAVATFVQKIEATRTLPMRKRLRGALDEANAAIAGKIRKQPELKGMGCTLLAVVVDRNHISWVSVGDSLLLLATPKTLDRCNADHSFTPLLEDAVSKGKLTRQEAATHPQRSVLRSALTGDAITLVDINELDVEAGTAIVAATDGILSISFRTIKRIMSTGESAEIICRKLIKTIEDNMPEDQDNATIVVGLWKKNKKAKKFLLPFTTAYILAAAIAMLIASVAGLVLYTLYVSKDKGKDKIEVPGSDGKPTNSKKVDSAPQNGKLEEPPAKSHDKTKPPNAGPTDREKAEDRLRSKTTAPSDKRPTSGSRQGNGSKSVSKREDQNKRNPRPLPSVATQPAGGSSNIQSPAQRNVAQPTAPVTPADDKSKANNNQERTPRSKQPS